jgi:hypothetical protein
MVSRHDIRKEMFNIFEFLAIFLKLLILFTEVHFTTEVLSVILIAVAQRRVPRGGLPVRESNLGTELRQAGAPVLLRAPQIAKLHLPNSWSYGTPRMVTPHPK